jgi:hypothetical protein
MPTVNDIMTVEIDKDPTVVPKFVTGAITNTFNCPAKFWATFSD